MTTDPRPRVPLNGKTVDLGQLAAEVGVALVASEDAVVVADEQTSVTAEQLQAAVDSHIPAPVPDTDAEFRAAVQGASTLAALKAAILGSTGPGAEPRRADAR